MAMITPPQQWFDTLMLGHGLFMSGCDSCVYFKKYLDSSFVYLLLYVDGMLNVSNNMFEINSLKDQLSGEFEMKDLEVAKKIVGNEIRINRSIDKLYLS